MLQENVAKRIILWQRMHLAYIREAKKAFRKQSSQSVSARSIRGPTQYEEDYTFALAASLQLSLDILKSTRFSSELFEEKQYVI